MRKFGLAAILTFVDKGASRGMLRAGKIAASLRGNLAGISGGARQVGAGLRQVTTALLPLTAALGFAARDGMKFEQSIANLRAVALDVSGRATASLKSLAKTMGATTVFSATQAADAMTNLKRAGLSVKQVAGAIPGTLAAAAAEGMSLAKAADIVAGAMKGFGLSAERAGEVAGSLALVSARTNTNMVQLQEGMKLAAPTARLAGFAFKDTALALGSLADIGLKGTMSGTALRAAMGQILSPTKKVLAAVGGRKGLNEVIRDSSGHMKPLTEIMIAFAAKLRKIPDRGKRVDVAMKIFGKRAVAVMSAFDLSGKSLEAWRAKQAELAKETGNSATAMAKLQLQTLGGQFKLVRSAVEAVNIELYGLASSGLRGGVANLAGTIGKLSLALRVVRGEKFTDAKTLKQVKELPKAFMEVARGIKEGFAAAKETLKSVFSAIGGVLRRFGVFVSGSTRGMAKIITKIALLAAAFAPVALAVGGVTRLFAGLARTAAGAAKVVGHTLALGAKGAGGLLAAVGSKFPKVAGLLGKFGGLLGKAGRLTEQVTAQPVRVVNFHEAGLGGLGTVGAAGNSAALASGTAQTVGALTRFRGGLAATVGKLGRFGTFLNSGALAASTAASSSARVAAALGKAGLVAAALGAGYALGTLIDRATGASDKISNYFFKNYKEMRDNALAPAKRMQNSMKQTLTSVRSLNQMLAVQQKFGGRLVNGKREAFSREYVTNRLVEGFKRSKLTQAQIATQLGRLAPILAKFAPGKAEAAAKPVKPAADALVSAGGFLPVSAGDVVLDRASLAAALTSGRRGGLLGAAGGGALGGGNPGTTSPAPAAGGGSLRLEVPVSIDGRQIALAVAEVKLDELERGGGSLPPGDRGSLLSRGFAGVTP